MASHIEKIENNKASLHMEFSPEEFKKGLSVAYKRNAKNFRIPGFRPGKAPMNVAMRYYGEGVLYDDAIDHLLNEAYPKAIDEHKLEPVDRPELDIQEIGSDKGLKVLMQITVKPEVQLGRYKGVEAVRRDTEVKDSDVTAELERVRERNSRMVPVEDRPIEDGDTANIDYEGFKDGEAFDGGKGEGYDLRIGSKSFIPGFEEQLIGHSAGEDVELNLSFPEDYHAEELKGQAVVFKVHINSVKVKELPELDDEFAKDVSEFDTLEEYRKDLREKQETRLKEQADREFENNAIEAAMENMTVDIPPVMIESEMDDMVRQQDQQMRGQGFDLQTYLGYLGQKPEEFREGFRDMATKRVKSSLLLEAVARAEAIEVSDEEVDAELTKMAEAYKQDPEEVKKNINEDGRRYFADNIKIQKAVELIRENAIPVAPPEVVEVKENENEGNKQENSEQN